VLSDFSTGGTKASKLSRRRSDSESLEGSREVISWFLPKSSSKRFFPFCRSRHTASLRGITLGVLWRQRELYKIWEHARAPVSVAVFSAVALSLRTRAITDLAAALAIAISVGIFVSSPGKYARLVPLATIAGILTLAYVTLVEFHSGTPPNDFLQFYVGAGTLGAPDFYGTAAERATRESLSQHQFPMVFVRLPFYAWLLRPLTRLSYHTAYVIWQAASAASFFAAVLLRHRHRLVVAVASAWSIPIALAWIRGQDVGFLLLALTLAMFLLETGRPGAGGAMLSLCAVKWNLFLTLPLFLVRFRSARFLLGFFITLTIILLVSFAVAGAGWPGEYLRLLQRPELSPHVDGMPNLRGLSPVFLDNLTL
jgi:hypothetical protein